MTIPPLNLDPVLLAAHVAKAFTTSHRLAYAQIDSSLKVVQTSPNFNSLLEGTALSIIGRFLPDLLWEFVGAESVLEGLLTGSRHTYRIEHVNRIQPDGSISYLTFQVTPLFQEQPGQGLLLLIEDETGYGRLQQSLVQDRNELRLVQRQLKNVNQDLNKLNKLKSLFLSMAAHDLRTPLTAIRGYTTLLNHTMADRVTEKEQKYLNTIFSQTDRLNRLIGDLLDLDQVEQGALVISPAACNLKTIIEEVVLAFQAQARLEQVSIETTLPTAAVMVQADSERIWRAIANLVGNAVKYTPAEGKVLVNLQTTPQEVILTVSDTGPGMKEEAAGNLFAPYYRTEEAKASDISGTGLGLYIVKSIVEAHHGRISVTTQLGKGTTFSLSLPLISDDE